MLIKSGAVVLPYDSSVVQAIPYAKEGVVNGQHVVACRHGLDETLVLRNLGFPVPSPISTAYNYTGRFKPMAHQTATAEFLTLHRRCFVLNDMGTGKTASALWAIDYLMQQGILRRVLIVAPLSCIGVWVNEAFAVTPHRTIAAIHGSREKRRGLLDYGTEICVINHDGVHTVLDTLKDAAFDLVLVDEAAAYRNASTRRYKSLRKLLRADTRLWLMTGTPVPTAPTDAHALILLVNPAKVPGSFKLFQHRVMSQISQYKWVAKPDSNEYVYNIMQPAIRFRKHDCIDLPPLVYMNRECELSAEQQKAYTEMRRRARFEQEGVPVTAANAAVKLNKLQQICCGVVRDEHGAPIYLNETNRLNLLEEVVEEAETKVVVFVPYIFAMERVAAHLRKRWEVAVVNGSVPMHERDRIFAAFQNTATPHVLVAHPQTAAHGLTLTAASTTVWYAPIFSAEYYTQANNRMDRPGQKSSMAVVHIGACPMEWQIYDALRARNLRQSTLLALYRQEIGEG